MNVQIGIPQRDKWGRLQGGVPGQELPNRENLLEAETLFQPETIRGEQE
jgi:hypothetical protein